MKYLRRFNYWYDGLNEPWRMGFFLFVVAGPALLSMSWWGLGYIGVWMLVRFVARY